MDVLLICREGTEDSVAGNVALAKALRESGRDAAVLFTGEALAAISRGPFAWSPLFANREARINISKNAQAQGLPLASERDPRWTDVRRLLRETAADGIDLLACPIWTELLGLDAAPQGLRKISRQELADALTSARVVIGGY